MLPNILSWSPNSADIFYSRLSGDSRKLYSYDIYTMISKPLSFEASDWFEIQAIHDEQFILHQWKRGIYLYDTISKKAQRMAKTEACRFFHYDALKKKLLYNNQSSAYLFDPVSMKGQKMIQDSVEFLIDPLHQTFISVSSDKKKGLSIFYKDESVFSCPEAFNIYIDPYFKYLIYLVEDDEVQKSKLHVLDLDQLKELHQETINGLIQNSHQLGNSILFNFQSNQSYGIYIFDSQSFKLKASQLIEHKDQLFAALSPKQDMLAILKDSELDSQIETIELENKD